jgi:hypothetical protein
VNLESDFIPFFKKVTFKDEVKLAVDDNMINEFKKHFSYLLQTQEEKLKELVDEKTQTQEALVVDDNVIDEFKNIFSNLLQTQVEEFKQLIDEKIQTQEEKKFKELDEKMNEIKLLLLQGQEIDKNT